MKHVIIGAGAAGIAAAKTLRQLDSSAEIVMISSDETVYSRCLLHKYIAEERSEDELSFIEPDFFETNRIQWLKGKTLTYINREQKKVVLDGSEAHSYDKLLLATGTESMIPPIGALRTAPNAFSLRHLSDAKKIAEKAKDCEKVVVVGAGLVGLDATYALLELGKKVTVVEMTNQLLPLNLDQHAANTYQKLFERHGATFQMGCTVTGTLTNRDGEITSVLLENGQELECDFVVAATGMKPSLEFLEDTGIEHERSVTVNARVQTNDPDIYAAGDITGIGDIWPNAVQQAKVAAENMVGRKASMPSLFVRCNTICFFDLTTLVVGDPTGDHHGSCFVQEDRKVYRKIVMPDAGHVSGVILQGDISYSGFWQQLVKHQIDISGIKGSVWDSSYADFFETDEKDLIRLGCVEDIIA